MCRATETADIIVAARRAAAAAADGGECSSSVCGNGHPTCASSNGGGGSGSSGSGNDGSDGSNDGTGSATGALEVLTDPALRERNLGVLQGLTRREAARLHPEAFASLAAPAQDPGEVGRPARAGA